MMFYLLATLVVASTGVETLTLGEASDSPVMVGDGQNIAVLWRNDGYPAGGKWERWISYRISRDGGQTFSSEQRIKDTDGITSATADHGVAHLCLHHEIGSQWTNAYSRVDLATGAASAPVRLTGNAGTLPTSCSVASAGPLVAVAWEEPADAQHQRLFLAQSTDGGRTLGASRAIGLLNNVAGFPRVAVGPPNVFVVWADDLTNGVLLVKAKGSSVSPATRVLEKRIATVSAYGDRVLVSGGEHVRMSRDEGRSFSEPTSLIDPSLHIPPLFPEPRIAWSGKGVYVVAEVSGGRGIYFWHSADGGTTFSRAFEIVALYSRDVFAPRVFSSAAGVIVTWAFNPQAGQSMVFRVSHDDGETFGAPVSLPYKDVQSGAYAPAASYADNRAVFFAWREPVGKYKGVIKFVRVGLR